MRTSALVSGSFREMLLLLCVQLFLASVFTFPSGDYWEDWGPYGECSRSCGGGVTARSRHCVTTRKDGGHSCVGPEKSYRSCNVQDCPEGSKDFREEQCSQFDGVDFQGKQYRWLPYYGGENPCELNCIPRGESFYYRHKPAVVDGTPCHPQGKDICVDGLCKPLGCDQMLESPQKEDPCLQCGGYGQTCTSIRNVFSIRNLPKGYNQIFTIPVGATSLSIKESVPTRNYFAIKNLRGEYYLNGHWLVDFSGVFPMAGTVLFYQRGSEGEKSPEIITARGPITEPLVIELITQEANQGVEYEYYLLNGGLVEDYYWSYGSWSSCSKECGLGYQSRVVFCTFDDEVISDARCAPQPRPLSNRTCNEQLCPQIRSWVSSEWLPCPVTCGGALQTRQVECVLHDDAGSRTVEDSQCSAYTTRPVSQQRCSTQQCAHYSVRHWSQCSVTCGLGKQTREVLCIDSDGASLEDYKCGSQPKPPRTQECEMPVCRTPIGWHIGDWGMCSKSCGSGLRERQVICSDRQRNLHQVEVCQVKPKPSTVESCNKQHCSQPQEVPSMQDPTGHDNTAQGFLPFLEDSWPEPPPKPECILSPYGCCSDGRTPAKGPQLQGCAGDYGLPSCTRTRFGCCRDGVSAAHGPAQEGCPDSRLNANPVPSAPGECELSTYGCCYDGVTAAAGTDGEGCSEPLNRTPRSLLCDLPYAAGSCDQWTARYYYDRSALRCSHFWYGGCHGNSNNFITEQECQRKCLGSEPLQQDQAHASNWQNDEHMIASHNPPRSSAFSMSAGGVSIDQSDPSSVEGQVGQRVLLLCRVTASSSSSSELMLEWRRDGNPVDPRRHQQRPDGSLVLAPVTRHDSGWFLCVATKGQERDHRYVYLSVSEDSKEVETPEVDSSRTNTSPSFNRVHIDYSPLVEAREGQTARLQCLVFPTSAMHSVTVHWSRGEHTLNFLRYSQHSDGTLVIKHVRSEDSGSYSCTVTHALWTEERQIQLRVFGELKMLEAPSDVSVLPGHSAQLFCRVTGEDVRLGWSRNGVLVRGDGRRVLISADGTLTITDVRSGDEGKYSCNAYTGTSSISATAELRLDRSPQEVGHQDCVDQPELANCELVVYTRLCSNQYFSSFCCASCTPYSSQKKANDA